MEYCFACDLGTTTVDLCLIDTDNRVVGERHFKNRQALYGADVISRIKSAERPEILTAMRYMVKEDIATALQEMLYDLTTDSGTKITGGAICGNTTMIALISGLELNTLGAYPFRTPFNRSFHSTVKELFGDHTERAYIDPGANVLLSGCASAFIGGDVLAGVLALSETESMSDEHTSLLIDLGTNGEMVLNRKGSMHATSAACGPAFEGCVRRQGIYGSTLLDAIALGLRAGRIDQYGSLVLRGQGDGSSCPPFGGQKNRPPVPSEPSPCPPEPQLNIGGVKLDSDILRQVLLAKAAIRAGIETLLSHADLRAEEVEQIYVAGGFGFYLNEETAVYLGLFPSEFAGRIKIAGNTSLEGARLLLKKPALLDRLNELCEDGVKVIQAANDEHYQDILISYMRF